MLKNTILIVCLAFFTSAPAMQNPTNFSLKEGIKKTFTTADCTYPLLCKAILTPLRDQSNPMSSELMLKHAWQPTHRIQQNESLPLICTSFATIPLAISLSIIKNSFSTHAFNRMSFWTQTILEHPSLILESCLSMLYIGNDIKNNTLNSRTFMESCIAGLSLSACCFVIYQKHINAKKLRQRQDNNSAWMQSLNQN